MGDTMDMKVQRDGARFNAAKAGPRIPDPDRNSLSVKRHNKK
jgi:hypothetical protein